MVCGTRLVMWLNNLIQLHRMLEGARMLERTRSCSFVYRNILAILQNVAIHCTVCTIAWCVRLHCMNAAFGLRIVCTIVLQHLVCIVYDCIVYDCIAYDYIAAFGLRQIEKIGNTVECTDAACSSANPGLNQISRLQTRIQCCSTFKYFLKIANTDNCLFSILSS